MRGADTNRGYRTNAGARRAPVDADEVLQDLEGRRMQEVRRECQEECADFHILRLILLPRQL